MALMRTRRATMILAGTVSAMLLLSGCSAAGAQGEYHPIPSTSARPADPVQTTGADGSVSAADAPLDQLWALVDSSLRDPNGYPVPDGTAGGPPQDVADFAAAVRSRCAPRLDASDGAELASLDEAVVRASQTTGADLTAAVRAYVDRATALCM